MLQEAKRKEEDSEYLQSIHNSKFDHSYLLFRESIKGVEGIML